MMDPRSTGGGAITPGWLAVALLAAVLVPVPIILRAQEDPARKEGPRARAEGAAGAPEERTPGETCSVSPTGTLLAGRPDEAQAAMTNRWTKRNLNVTFFDGQDPWNLSVRQKVRAIVGEWEKYADLRFTFDPAAPADIAITLVPSPQYPKYGVYQSVYGPAALNEIRFNRPSMWLLFRPDTDDAEIRRVTLHEFGHGLGLIHEQKRPDVGVRWDEEAVFRYYAFTGWTRKQIREQVMNPFTGPLIGVTPFDPTTIMIYPIPPGLANIVVGWTRELSAMDKLFISVMYPMRDTPAVSFQPMTPGGPPVQDAIDAAGRLVAYRFAVPEDGRYAVEARG